MPQPPRDWLDLVSSLHSHCVLREILTPEMKMCKVHRQAGDQKEKSRWSVNMETCSSLLLSKDMLIKTATDFTCDIRKG